MWRLGIGYDNGDGIKYLSTFAEQVENETFQGFAVWRKSLATGGPGVKIAASSVLVDCYGYEIQVAEPRIRELPSA